MRVLTCVLLLTLSSSCLCSPVMLTPLIEAGNISLARTLSQVKEPNLYNGTSHAGYLTVDNKLGNHLFFWFFPSMENSSAPLLVWLNGGPGVSSMLGVFWENGPVMWDSSTSALKPREFSWVGPFSMLYIDSPVGVGFSFSDSGDEGLRVTREEYTADLYTALTQFYKMFPEFSQLDLYLGGQSYGAKYATYLAHYIDRKAQSNDTKLPLAGLYLGGPMVNFEKQMPEYYNFVYQMGFQSKAPLEERKEKFMKLMKEINDGQKKSMYDLWVVTYSGLDLGFPINDNFDKPVIPDFEVDTILANEDFKNAIHVADVPFVTYNQSINMMYAEDLTTPARKELGQMLENYKVLVYNGNYDATVSSSMVDVALLAAEWPGKEQYKMASRSVWKSKDGQVKGYFSFTGQLCRVVVHRAGAQTPHDQPQVVRQMMEQFVQQGCLNQ